ncbi:MAG: hypothetical protein DYH12_30425 [Sorangiineae bacterium PRO1]|nr:hypothetical protein [Sorangiineae bacterium PRO1]
MSGVSHEYSEIRSTPDDPLHALRAHCRGFRAGVAAASDAEGRAFIAEARAVAVLRALGTSAGDANMILDAARDDAAAVLGLDADAYDVRCVAALLVIDLLRARLGGVE